MRVNWVFFYLLYSKNLNSIDFLSFKPCIQMQTCNNNSIHIIELTVPKLLMTVKNKDDLGN